MAVYNLQCVPRINELLFDKEQRFAVAKSLNLNLNTYNFAGVDYFVLRYNKSSLTKDNESTIGLLRSVIFKDSGEIVSFAPPKSKNVDNINFTPENTYICEQFIEGTMINMFYSTDNDKWQIATRSNIGGTNCFYMEDGYKKENTFGYMFDEIVNNICPDLKERLNENYVYSFVMQHPRNRIVKKIYNKRLYLVEMYEINGLEITCKLNDYNVNILDGVVRPNSLMISTLDEFNDCKKYQASANTLYSTMGFVMKDLDGNRYKFRNPNYEYVRGLRGNQAKLQYQYLVLRQEKQIVEYLKYYPEQTKIFNEYRTLVHKYTNQLFENYVKCYIKKERELKQFPSNFRVHMYDLHHDHYINNLKQKKEIITRTYVINYFNKVHPAKQMYVLNWNKRFPPPPPSSSSTSTPSPPQPQIQPLQPPSSPSISTPLTP
jgi:hypothetical protein